MTEQELARNLAILGFLIGTGILVLAAGAYAEFIKAKYKLKNKLNTEENLEENDVDYMLDSPADFDSFIGQPKAVELLKMHVMAAGKTGKTIPHILLEGPGGTGKTTLAFCVANEASSRLFVTTPSTFKDKDSVINFFFNKDFSCKIKTGDIIFIDEIHRVRESAAIYLYSAMQDNYIDVGGAILELPEFTMVGATTDSGMLPGPFRDRFKIKVTLESYCVEDIANIIMDFKHIDKEPALAIATKACGIPRIAKSIADTAIAHAIVNTVGVVNSSTIDETCKLLEIDKNGLNKSAKKVIKYFQSTDNAPIGISNLAGALNLSKETLEHEIFPVLYNLELLISKGTRGRCLSNKGIGYKL